MNVTNIIYSLEIMGKGMLGIFTVIILITLVVLLMGKIGNGKKKDSE